MQVEEATVSNVNDIQQAAQSLVGKVDAVYVPTDNVLASAMPTLAQVTEPAKLAVVCGEGGMVHGRRRSYSGDRLLSVGRTNR